MSRATLAYRFTEIPGRVKHDEQKGDLPMSDKHTGDKAASAASDVLQDGRTSADSKRAAASALSQAGDRGTEKHTSGEAAEAASGVLQSDDTGDKSKTAAGSALSQADKKAK